MAPTSVRGCPCGRYSRQRAAPGSCGAPGRVWCRVPWLPGGLRPPWYRSRTGVMTSASADGASSPSLSAPGATPRTGVSG
eukprot:9472051-Pyramimonas_sp.AAC.2